MFSKLFAAIGSFFAITLGKINWTCPPWLFFLREKSKHSPKLFWSGMVGILVILAAAGYGYYWFSHLPKPELVTANIMAPSITPLTEELFPEDLVINFGIKKNKEFAPQSVAPLSSLNKKVKGVTLTPDMPGKWTWRSDNTLVFAPKKDWPAGQRFTIQFDKTVFASTIRMEALHFSFTTQPFQATIADFKFYQDPVNPAIRQAVATIDFNFPVDTKSFQNHIRLAIEALKKGKLDLEAKTIPFTLTYDKHNRIAYLRSENLILPDVSRYLVLTLDKGIQSETGSAKTTNLINKNLLIPDKGNYFKITSAKAEIIRNPQDRPEQALTIESTVGITEAAMNKALHVYLLPENYPATASEIEKPNYQWVNPGEVTPAILALSNSLHLKTIPTDRNYATLHSYIFSTKTPRFIYLKLDKGGVGFGGFTLAAEYKAIIKVPELPREISFIHKGALLALGSEQKLSVLIRGLEAVKFEVARILPDNVNQLVTQSYGDFNNPFFVNQSFDQYNISEIFSTIQHFDVSDLAKQNYTALDFAKYLSTKPNTGGPQGLFLLNAIGWDSVNNTSLDIKSSRLILVTDMGMLVKDNLDGSHDVFVQSITKGMPVPNASVSILGKNGLPVLTRITDDQGRANFPTLKDFVEERAPVVYLAALGNDVSFIPYQNNTQVLNVSRFDVGGLYTNNQDQNNLSAFLFTDRGIYRPGDTVHVGMIVKQTYLQPQSPGLPLQVTVTDPRGNTILDKKLTVDELGFLSVDFSTQSTSPTGQYFINLYIVKDNQPGNLLGSSKIRVNEFLPDRMRINAKLSQESPEGWISPVKLQAKVDLWNLYGAPAVDRRISAKILLSPKNIHFEKYPDYFFADPLLDPHKPPKVFTDNLKDLITNDKGEVQFNLNLERFDKATYQLTFFAEGFEAESGRSVAAQASALVSPMDYLVGYKADGDLQYIKQNTKRSVHFIAINPQLKQENLPDLKLQLIALHPVSTLVKKPDGTFQYQSIIQSTIIQTKPFVIPEQGLDYDLPATDIGDYALVVLDKNGTELSRVKFSIIGESQKPLAKNAELSVKLNKTEYAAGDTIELQITAPYTGAGLITIERDKVYATQWFKTENTNSVQTIRIPENFEGNGYLNISFVRDWSSPDIFISPLSYNVIPFSVTHEKKTLKIDLDVPAQARPGEPMVIHYKTDKPGKMVVFAVDQGILQITRFKTPDPLDFFFQKRSLEVSTRQTLDQILPKFIVDRELSAVGGDDGEEALSHFLNPFKRKTDLPVVYWSGIVDTDTTSKELTYTVPDYFNGSLRTMAIAVSEDAVGSADKQSEVRGDFIINPNVPTFVAPGDIFEITASVANTIKNSGDLVVSVHLQATPELELIGNSEQSLTIKEGREQTVHFKVKAKELTENAKISFVANAGSKTGAMNVTLSIRPSSNFITAITSGSTKDVTKSLTLDRTLYPQYRQLEAAVSTNPLILITGLQRYLNNFPYGCTEQITSQALPLLAIASQPSFAKDPQAMNEKIMETIRLLGQRQMTNGGFSYWPGWGENVNNTFATVYALHFLTEAKAQGYNVSLDILSRGIDYLKNLVSTNPSNLETARIQAYAIYVLTRNEIVTTNYLTNLQIYLAQNKIMNWEEDIMGAYIASTYQLLQNETEATRLINNYKLKVAPEDSTDFYNQAIADAQYLYLIARHFPSKLPSVGQGLVNSLVNTLNTDQINTVLSGYASLALGAYNTSAPTIPRSIPTIAEILPDNQEKLVSPPLNAFEKVTIDGQAKQIRFNNPSKTLYFYQLIQAGFDKKVASKEIKQGLEISREYRDSEGNVVNSVKLGSELEVHIYLRTVDNHYLTNIAIVDLLPGGFEVVRESVNNELVDYSDVREDRVVFFTSANPQVMEITYRIKATNRGEYTVPAIIAQSMYNPALLGSSVAGKMVVKD